MYIKVKNFIDPILAIALLIILLPILIFIAILIYFKMGKPIIFKQKRPGLNCKLFNFYKFRTMNEISANGKNDILESERVTSLGKILRSTSLDELPSIINIVKGQMSFIGPRPLLADYLILYDENQIKRHNVKPGITGLAQISGRNLVDWNKRFDYDLEYIKHQSPLLDLKIIFKTIIKVVKREGINNSNTIIMKKFTGNEKS